MRTRLIVGPRTIGSLTLVLAVMIVGGAPPAARGEGAATAPAPSPGARVLKFSPTMPPEALKGRADGDLVELSDGRRIRIGDVRRLTAAAQKMRTASGDRRPQALLAAPAASGRHVANAGDLATALKGSDHETVQLPSGRRITVGQIKLVQPQIEKQLGHRLEAAAPRREPTGPATKVGANADWKSILQKPDRTVLEAPDGTRITVGELKQALASEPSATPGGASRLR